MIANIEVVCAGAQTTGAIENGASNGEDGPEVGDGFAALLAALGWGMVASEAETIEAAPGDGSQTGEGTLDTETARRLATRLRPLNRGRRFRRGITATLAT